jgi:hypothetical protein
MLMSVSYNVMIVVPPVPQEDAAAWSHVQRLAEASYDDARPPPQLFSDLYARLTKRYPCICSLSDDQVDEEGVWSDGPLINNFCHEIVILGLVFSRADDVIPFIEETAVSAGLVFFDPQQEYISRPGSGPSD